MMDFSVIVIGDEILLGQVTDTNSGFIARTLAPDGWTLKRVLTVGDDPLQIRQAINICMADSRLVITTGGLGPTKDDLTKAVLTERFGGRLERDPAVTENIRRVFSLRGLQLNPLTADQALVPTSCRVIQNRFGTAPVMWFEEAGHVLIAMPGVPFETEGMISGEVGEAVHNHFCADSHTAHHTLLASGITESALASHLEDFELSIEGRGHLAYLPVPGFIRLRLDVTAPTRSEAEAAVELMASDLRSHLGDYLLYDGDATAEEMVLELLRRRHLTMSTAESCTGGTIAGRITAIPGASEVFSGSVVSYSNDVKRQVLGVSAESLTDYGAVSEAVVRQMAEGACRLLSTDCAVATSGIAGPGGGTDEKPVGTVWMAVCTPSGTESRCMRLPGNRRRVIDRAGTEVLLMLYRALRCD
ncbi:MAG: CinA family nicotinamide mononucleotide deamidase-related protein [Muribaculaceae bacterium]|nr:CinA family nicotinamide mononucleotide deamidase-related protein [Muribaculaceae bacterium]